MSDIPTHYWDHGLDCWHRDGVDVTGDIALTPESEGPYCAMTTDERLADDPSAEPSTCGGRWVKLIEVTDD